MNENKEQQIEFLAQKWKIPKDEAIILWENYYNE